MAIRLTQEEIIEAVETMFRAGVPQIRFLALKQDEAERYRDFLDVTDYEVEMDGPSLNNDPLKEKNLYSVIITAK